MAKKAKDDNPDFGALAQEIAQDDPGQGEAQRQLVAILGDSRKIQAHHFDGQWSNIVTYPDCQQFRIWGKTLVDDSMLHR